MLTTSNEARQAIRSHIVEQISDIYSTASDLINQLHAITDTHTPDTFYHSGKKMVQGGCFLIQNYDIEQFLLQNGLTTEKHLEKYDAFEFYAHLIGRELQTIEKWYDAEALKSNATN